MKVEDLRKTFRYIPGDVVSRDDFITDEDDWVDRMKEPFIVDEVTIESNLDVVYSVFDDNGNCILLSELDFKQPINQETPKYIWGLQAEDFAAAVSDKNSESLQDVEVYSEEEFSDEDLRETLLNKHKNIFFINDWVEIVSYYAEERFSEEDWRIIATMNQRNEDRKKQKG